MLTWLSQINPNTVLSVVFLVGGWLWHQASTGKKTSIGDSLEALARQALHIVLADPALSRGNVETLATGAVWSLAA